MYAVSILLYSLILSFSNAAETVLGVCIFSRHGDRTPKSLPPANLTNLGYRQIFDSGTYFRQRYISSTASSRIAGINADLVKLSQIAASAPLDTVLINSAQGFLQGLYPPVGSSLASQKLRDGTVVEAPLNGYQLVPIQQVTAGAASEDSPWLQGASNCAKATISSNEYYSSPEYRSLLNSTADFYKTLVPVVNGTFKADDISYSNAYTIFDLINVAEIHNASIPSADVLTPSTISNLISLANTHEYALSYNSSDSIRSIAGATLAAQIVQALNTTITSQGKSKINIQFGAYGSFLSFFGLAQLPQLNADFYGIPDYASTMTFELFTNASAQPFPDAADLKVRFLFHNGTTSNTSEPATYPLFGQQETILTWNAFVDGMSDFSIGSQRQWCDACGNTTGACAITTSPLGPATSSPSSKDTNSSGGMSKAVAGVIGAMVAMAVILGIEAIVMLTGGLSLVSKKRIGQGKMEQPVKA